MSGGHSPPRGDGVKQSLRRAFIATATSEPGRHATVMEEHLSAWPMAGCFFFFVDPMAVESALALAARPAARWVTVAFVIAALTVTAWGLRPFLTDDESTRPVSHAPRQ